MDAREYLEQVRRQRLTLMGKQMDVEEARETYDLLRGASIEGVSGSRSADAIFTALQRYEEIIDSYVTDLLRWTDLHDQARDMLDRARAVVLDGRPHAVDLAHVEVLNLYYLLGMRRGQIAREMGYSTERVDQRKREALDWLDHARGPDGMPLVPIVSE